MKVDVIDAYECKNNKQLLDKEEGNATNLLDTMDQRLIKDFSCLHFGIRREKRTEKETGLP